MDEKDRADHEAALMRFGGVMPKGPIKKKRRQRSKLAGVSSVSGEVDGGFAALLNRTRQSKKDTEARSADIRGKN